MPFCTNCGEKVEDDQIVCSRCGESLENEKEQSKDEINKVIAETKRRAEWEAASIITEAKRRAEQIISSTQRTNK